MKNYAIFQKCDGPTDRPTDIAASRVAFTRLTMPYVACGWAGQSDTFGRSRGEQHPREINECRGRLTDQKVARD